jgi:lysophospholipase L1-like esterase
MESRSTVSRATLAITLLSVTVASYFWGAVTVYKQIFPYPQLQALKYKYLVPYLQPPKHEYLGSPLSRYMMFRTFSPRSDVVMIGDSLTSEAPWNEIFPKVQIANRGMSGDTTNDILSRMDTILSVSPKKALIMVGINDVDRGAPVDSVFQNYTEIVKNLQRAGVNVIIQSTLECSKRVCGDRVFRVRELNKQLKDFAHRSNILFVDINADLSSPTDGLLSKYTSDGIHLLPSGYVKWSEKIGPYIYAGDASCYAGDASCQ